MKFCLGTAWGKIERGAGVINSVEGQALRQKSQDGATLNTAQGGMKFWLGARWDKICRSVGILDCVQGKACAEDSQGDPKFNTAGGARNSACGQARTKFNAAPGS